jgi:hypothetical protein
MAQAPASSDTRPVAAKRPQAPPDERFWKRYSPHYELPLSFVIAVSLHVAAVLLLVFTAIWFVASSDSPQAPPRMDVVEIMGGDPGIDGLGVGNTPAGGGDKKVDAENVGEPDAGKTSTPPKQTQLAALQEPAKGAELKIPDAGTEPPDPDGADEAFAGLDKATRQATEDIINATRPSPAPAKGSTNKGGKNPGPAKSGTGGRPNRGTGIGNRTGPGKGRSPYGQVLTDQRKRQMRWQILASTNGQIHLAKLKALRVTLVMPTLKPGEFQIFDLERSLRPQYTKRLEEQADKVWWTNRDPVEVATLAQVLAVPKPPCFVIFLPKALEDRMVQLEGEYQGAREEQIEKTIWDVPLRNGRYASEPQVVRQILKRPY